MFSKSGSYDLNLPKHYSQPKYYTFTPKPLCGRDLVQVDEELAFLLAKAHRLIGILEGMSALITNIDAIESMLIKKEAVASCRIDGIEENFEDVVSLSKEGNPKVVNSLRYIKVLDYNKKNLANQHLSNKFLCKMHNMMMEYAGNEEVGKFRKTQTFFGSRAFVENFPDYNPPAPDDMHNVLIDLEKYITSDERTDVLVRAALIHYQFETVHPFVTGNGRIGRILNNLFLTEDKILSRQLLCISNYLLQNKVEYFDRLNEVQRFGKYEQWVKFFIKAFIASAEDSINIIKRLLKLRDQNIAKIMTLGKSAKLAMILYEYIEKTPIIDINKTAEALNLSFNTISKAVESLLKIEILKQRNNSIRYRCFAYEEYLEIIR